MSAINSTMLVRLKLTSSSFKKMDRKATDEFLDTKAAGQEAGKFTKQLLPSEAIKPVDKMIGAIRTANKNQTLPFDDTSWRILTTEHWHDHNKMMNALGTELESTVEEFIKTYDYWKERAKVMLNGMYSEADYMTHDEIRDTYRMEVKYRDVPRGSNFLVDMSDDNTKAIRQSIEQDTNQKLAAAQKDLWMQMLEVTSHFAAVMGDKDKKFRNSTMENIKRVTELVPKINITGDAELNKLAADINHTLLSYDPDQLRQNPTARGAAAQAGKDRVDAIQSAMAGVFV